MPNSNLSNGTLGVLLVVLTCIYAPFGRSSANKRIHPIGWIFLFGGYYFYNFYIMTCIFLNFMIK